MNEIQQVEALPELSYGQWEEQGRVIAKIDHANRWSLADWLAVGEKWQTRNTYDFAQRIFPDYSRKHLQELAYVARSVNLPVRQESLSFTHHQLVTAMEPADQTRWLTWAVKQKASVSTLRSAISAERMTESPLAVPLPVDLLEKVKVLACATGMTAEALVIKAVVALVAQSAEEIKKESDAAVAKQEARFAAADARDEMNKLLEKALRVAQKEWKEKAALLQDAYVKDNMPEDVVRAREGALSAGRDAAAVRTAANSALNEKPDDEALKEAAREAAKTLDDATAALRDAHGTYHELRHRLVAEAEEKFPTMPPQGLQRTAQVARAAANLAAYELQRLTIATRLADEAEQLAREAEAKVTPEALAAEADEIKRGPQEPLHTPRMFEVVTA